MKGVGNITVKYAINNSGNFDNSPNPFGEGMISHILNTNELFNDLLNFKTFRYKTINGNSIKNCQSIALRIESSGTEGFELNDITITYREKTL